MNFAHPSSKLSKSSTSGTAKLLRVAKYWLGYLNNRTLMYEKSASQYILSIILWNKLLAKKRKHLETFLKT